MNFSLNFPDTLLFTTLGDDIIVRAEDGTETAHKGEFATTYEDEELADRISDEHYMVEMQPEFADLYKKGVKVLFNGNVYSYINQHTKDANTKVVILREEVDEVW